jgi:hypothetical protein
MRRRSKVRPLFPPWTNTLLRLAIAGVAFGIVGLPAFLIAWARSPYATGQNEPVVQPVKFDHRHHVRDDGIDCLYCHGDAQRSRFAGVPPTGTCMGCHAQIRTDSPELELVRSSFATGTPIAWQRVNTLPDFVYFDHRIHVSNGVGCVTCHGRVDLMPVVHAARPLTMRWCIDCHRDSTSQLRSRDRITDMEAPNGGPVPQVKPRTDCSACHR